MRISIFSDLAMDELDLTSDESNSSQCFDIETISGGAEKIAQVRAHALNLRKHVCIPLKAQRKRPKIFDFTDNVVGETTYFPEGTYFPKNNISFGIRLTT